ncbi:MAG: DUF58 domain-containing protein, partial [Gammaproteobacteria bacterium]
SQRNVFIFPTPTGFGFAGLCVLILIGGINYQSSMVLGVAFLLGSVFVLTIIHTFQQLSGLALVLDGPARVFAGEPMVFRLHNLRSPPPDRRRVVRAGWPGSPPVWLPEPGAGKASLPPLQARRRGRFRPPRLRIESRYPLGLLRAWALPAFDLSVLVWPTPDFALTGQNAANDGVPVGVSGQSINESRSNSGDPTDGTDARPFRPGDRPRAVLWRAWARGWPMLVRKADAGSVEAVPETEWLDFDQVQGDVEQRLSRLAGQALLRHDRGVPFGLRLKTHVVPPERGAAALRQAHLSQVMDALAIFRPLGENLSEDSARV